MASSATRVIALLCLLLASASHCLRAASPPATKCPKHQVMCQGICTDSRVDELNCGACGHDCTALTLDPYGACCKSKCVDFGYDSHHCGACDRVCPQNTTCCSQACTSVLTDIFNCGACDNICDSTYCCDGKCTNKKSKSQHCGCEPYCP